MNISGVPAGITALAYAIAESVGDDELELISAVFVMLGDTLAAIAAAYSCEKSRLPETRER